MAQGLPDVFARMDKSAKGFVGMAADIRQTTHTEIVNDDSTQSGTIKLKRVKPTETNFLVDFTKPDAKTVAIAGGEVSIYLPKAKSVQIYDLRAKRAALEQGMLLGFGAASTEIKAAYEVSFVGQETVAGQSAGHIKLIPKSKEVLQSLKSAELWIGEQGIPVQQKFVTSGTGDYSLMQYTNVRINPSISDKDLKLTLPKGVQVQKVGK
jgi:outer membrane lipoprotein-sorting protein